MYYSLKNWWLTTTGVWSAGKYDGQRVSKGHILQDGDVVEFHI
ncbi:hypothetical protein ACFLVV_03570 [Chloroflexota bacterium]